MPADVDRQEAVFPLPHLHLPIGVSSIEPE